MTLTQKINLAETIQQNISPRITNLWPNFTLVPFILYDADNQVAVGDQWPGHYQHERGDIWIAHGTDPQLMGNTAMEYHNRIVAIWDTRTWEEIPSISHASALIAHEMFHAYQTHMNLPWANEFLLPQYPHSVRSAALVLEENGLFAEMLANFDSPDLIMDCMKKIFALRKLREAVIGTDFMEYDGRLEGAEGTAAYVEIKLQAILEGKTPFECAASYLPALQSDGLLAEYRHRCYATGLILCLAADVLCPGWQIAWIKSGLAIFEFMQEKLAFGPVDVMVSQSSAEKACQLVSAFKEEKERRIAEFKKQDVKLIEGDIQLMSFDPMNLTCIDDLCLHMHGQLRYGNEEHLMDQPFLTQFGDHIMDVKRVWVRSDKKQL